MTDIKVSTLSVPKIPRNKRIYSEYKSERVSIGVSETVIQSQRNIQAAILSYDDGDFVSRVVEIEFVTQFTETPVGDVRVYRYDTRSGGGVFLTNAVYYVDDVNWKTNIGFKITIEDYEDLNGLFIEYLFTERSDVE